MLLINDCEIIYSAVRLLPGMGLLRLQNLVCNWDDVVYCDHMTLGFGENVTSFHVQNVGKKATLRFNRVHIDEKKLICAQIEERCARVWGCSQMFPHVTVSCRPSIKPVESNNVLYRYYEGDPEIYSFETPDAPPLEGVVDLFVKTPDGQVKWFLE